MQQKLNTYCVLNYHYTTYYNVFPPGLSVIVVSLYIYIIVFICLHFGSDVLTS